MGFDKQLLGSYFLVSTTSDDVLILVLFLALVTRNIDFLAAAGWVFDRLLVQHFNLIVLVEVIEKPVQRLVLSLDVICIVLVDLISPTIRQFLMAQSSLNIIRDILIFRFFLFLCGRYHLLGQRH